MLGQHLASVYLNGCWRENSGKIWHCVQNGNTFTWKQEGTKRTANGIIVPHSNGFDWVILITFDSSVSVQLKPTADFNSLISPSDTFVRTPPLPTPHVFGHYQDNFGKIWTVKSSTLSHFSLHNQHDGKSFDVWFARDALTGKYSLYLKQNNVQGDHLLKVETDDLNVIPLNSEVLKKI